MEDQEGEEMAGETGGQVEADRAVLWREGKDVTGETAGQMEEQGRTDHQVKAGRTVGADVADASAEPSAEGEDGEGVPREVVTVCSPFAHVNMYDVLSDDDDGGEIERAAPRRSRRVRRIPGEVYGTSIDPNSIDLRTLRCPSRARSDK